MNRREFGGLLATAMTVPAMAARAGDGPRASKAELKPMHDRRRPEVGMLLYPGLTLMDLLGPQRALATSANVHLVWKRRDLIESDSGIVLCPSATLAESAEHSAAIARTASSGKARAIGQDPRLADSARSSRSSKTGLTTPRNRTLPPTATTGTWSP